MYPQSELQGDKAIVLNPAAVGEPVKLPTTKKMALPMSILSLIQLCSV